MTLSCPRTATPLKKLRLAGVTVDYSEVSGGVFFDRFELQHFEGPENANGEALASVLEAQANQEIDAIARVCCPRHPDVTMMRRFYSPMRQVEIDECPACGGIWLDSGELDDVRRAKQALTPEQVSAAVSRSVAQAYVHDAGSGSIVNPMNAKVANHRFPALIAALGVVLIAFGVSPELQVRIVSYAASALVMLWWPWFFVWDAPRRFHMKPAPIQYIYVFGWATMALAYGIAVYDIVLR